MFKKATLFSTSALLGLTLASATAFGQTPASGAGSVVSETPSEPGKIGAWVFRTGDDGLALNVQPVPFSTKYKGYLRQYKKVGDVYTPTDIKLQVDDTGGTPPANLGDQGIEVSIVPKETTGSLQIPYYELTYLAPGGVTVKVGAMRFLNGNAGRSGTDVVLRVNSKLKSLSRNPCDEPPIDDMGEEEILDQSASTLPLTAVAATTIEE
jgi:hypothetical protein